jgi:hypothetical protein
MPSNNSTTSIVKTSTSVSSKAKSSSPAGSGEHTTDVIYQDIKLYIEGIQVPFSSISISQSLNALPSAEIEVPPQAGLMDICRCYQPKVHIFYEDLNYGGYRLLFWGHIQGNSYQHSRAGSGSASIRFHALHKNALMTQLTLDFMNYLNPQSNPLEAPGSNQTQADINSMFAVMEAMKGISGIQTDPKDELSPLNADVATADITKLMKSHSSLLARYSGMPGISMTLWNKTKKSTYSNVKYNTMYQGVMVPLVEDGLSFFKRLSGHPYIEDKLSAGKVQTCLHNMKADIVVPPAFKVALTTAVQTSISVQVATNAIQFSGELTSFVEILGNLYRSVSYEMVTLASPAEVPVDPAVRAADIGVDPGETMAIETIVKPEMPFYYAPVCNVIFPRMYHTVQVAQEEASQPTRVTATYDSTVGASGRLGMNYRGPHSIREAIAYGSMLNNNATEVPDLTSTLQLLQNVPGRYEQGRGILNQKIALPMWLQMLAANQTSLFDGNGYVAPNFSSPEYLEIAKICSAWRARNGYKVWYGRQDGMIHEERELNKDKLNPYDPNSRTQPYQIILFTSVDYLFTQKMAASRTGVVDAVFNPYIIPGYPMDVLDDTPNHPSFHGLCTSVTHSISASGISTSIGMSSVQTYAELSNYYTPPAPPWMVNALDLIDVEGTPGADGSIEAMKVVNAGTLINNEKGRLAADNYYFPVLGVGSADPSWLMDFDAGQVRPQQRLNGSIVPGTKASVATLNGGESNDYLTTSGNLRLVARPIETREKLSERFKYTFVDLTPETYNLATVGIINPALENSKFLEPGASPFLEYMEPEVYIKALREADGLTSSTQVKNPNPTPSTNTQ